MSISVWIRLEQLAATPTAVFGVCDAHGAGVQLQLSRAGASVAHAELVVTDPLRASSGSSRLAAAFSPRGAKSQEVAALTFETDAVVRCGTWHLLTLSLRKGSLLSWAGSGRDEALLVIDSCRAARAPGFKFPTLSIDNALHGRAAVRAQMKERARDRIELSAAPKGE